MKNLLIYSFASLFISCKEKKESVNNIIPINKDINLSSTSEVKETESETFLDSISEKNPNLYNDIKEILGEEYMQEYIDNSDLDQNQRDFEPPEIR